MTTYRSYFLSFLLLLSSLVLVTQPTYAQDGEAAGADKETAIAGKKLFTQQCGACHKLNAKMIGPALGGVVERWDEAGEYEGVAGTQWLRRWIKNWQDPVNAGYPYAVNMQNYDASAMNAFPTLADADIDKILTYIQNPDLAEEEKKDDVAVAPVASGGGEYTELFLYVLVGMLVIITLILLRVSNVLNRLVAEKEGEELPEPVAFYKNKKLHATIALVLVLWLGSEVVNGAIDLGRQQGYAPTQPIKFSHELHAGINKVDCKYCHVGAAKGKQSVIPSANICMNCHKGVQSGEKYGKYGRREISKIYASIGFNPAELKYFENYEDMPYDTVAAIFTKWLEEDEVKHTSKEIDEVLAQIQKPIEWVRIHNLPDHVYFNHSQHVVVGGVECQTCHGPVETMEVLAQHAPLSMGWCLSCHRENEVNFNGNAFYDSYEQFHEDLDNKKFTKVTVEKIGGTECQKCHY